MDRTLTVNVTGWPRVSGVRPSLVLDPEGAEVSDTYAIGSGTSFAVWHRRELAFGARPDVVPERLAEWVEEHADDFLALADCYEGAEWDGHNHVGRWSDEAHDIQVGIQEALEQAMDDGRIPSYWEAVDWLGGDRAGVLAQARAGLAAGGTLADAAAREAEAALVSGAWLDEKEVEAALAAWLEEAKRDDGGEE